MAQGKDQNLELEIRSLREIVELQRKQLEQKDREARELQACIQTLEAEVDRLVEALKRLGAQESLSTPSSQKPTYEKDQKDNRDNGDSERQEENAKTIGRPKGAEGSTRKRLTEEDVEETRQVQETGCPHCGHKLSHVVIRSQIVETVIPARHRVVEIFWHEGRCPEHGEVTLRPGEVPPKGHLSNEVILMAAELVVGAGMSFEKVCNHLRKRFGIELTTGGLAQAFQRIALGMVDEVNAIEKKIRESEAVHGDETGARVDGESWWMWAFVTRFLASFRVEERRSSEVIFRVLGEHFLGVLISDFFSSYNVPDCRKQKCLTHLLRDLKEILLDYEGRPGQRPPSLLAMKLWAKDALELKDIKPELSNGTFIRRRAELEKRLDNLLASGSSHPDVLRLLERLWKHRDELLLFLYVESVEGTNNRAERAIRKAVLQRKVNGGHRSWAGAQTYAILLSVLVTCNLQDRDFVKAGLEILQRNYRGIDAGILTGGIGKKHGLKSDENRPP
jgi:hypothetical protein